MSTHKTNSPIPASAQLVLDFFDNELSEARFPDVDRTVLQEAADRVTALAEEVAKAEAALQAARDALHEGQEQLLGRCQRALAYARIYAEDDPDLVRRLDAISIPRQGRGKAAPAQGTGDPGEARPAARRSRKQGNGLFGAPPQDDLPI